jgi:DNA-binding NarL/FixJ family response regulator
VHVHRQGGQEPWDTILTRSAADGVERGNLGPLDQCAITSATEPGLAGLSPRLRQTLACLLDGDSEKEVATRLRSSQPTTHQYVSALYRHFGVRCRAQLLAQLCRLERPSRDVDLPGLGINGAER